MKYNNLLHSRNNDKEWLFLLLIVVNSFIFSFLWFCLCKAIDNDVVNEEEEEGDYRQYSILVSFCFFIIMFFSMVTCSFICLFLLQYFIYLTN